MGHCDKNGKRLKWTGEEKRMVRVLKAQVLIPEKSVLQLRGRTEKLGKYPARPSFIFPRPNQQYHPPYSPYSVDPIYPVYQVEQYYPIQPYQPEFFPIADDEGPSSNSRACTRARRMVNSVVVAPSHDEKRGNKDEWDDVSSSVAISPDLPTEDKVHSPEGTELTNDVEQISDETESTNSTEYGGFDPESDYDGDYDVEMSDPAEAKLMKLWRWKHLTLKRGRTIQTHCCKRYIYIYIYGVSSSLPFSCVSYGASFQGWSALNRDRISSIFDCRQDRRRPSCLPPEVAAVEAEEEDPHVGDGTMAILAMMAKAPGISYYHGGRRSSRPICTSLSEIQ